MTIGRNDPCWCGSGKKWKKCHFPAQAPATIHPAIQSADPNALRDSYLQEHGIILKTPKQIEGIRRSCQLAVDILQKTCKMAVKGVTTLELNDLAQKLHMQAGAKAAPLGYGTPPFPKSICTSLNEVICHGIPDNRALQDGDILNIDITCILDGYYGDCSMMVAVGEIDSEKVRVVDCAYECLMRAIEVVRPGSKICEIGNAIQRYAEQHSCSVVTQFVGHGVGLKFHEPPHVPHYKNELDIVLVPGMTFTIEPMINAGRKEAVVDAKDKWTARTIDGKPSAQWEHTLLVTDSGHEILTPWHR